jgi:hypothetical protein
MARKNAKPVGWNRALAYPIKLRDGGVISTMAQAARLMTQRLPKARQEKPVWQHTAELLMQAQKSGKAIDVRAATDQMCRALVVEGWIE